MSLYSPTDIFTTRDMAEFSNTSIGGELRAERLRQGIELSAISAETKIALPFLEAIEHDQFDCIPAGSYKKSFVQQYARALGLDEAEVIAAFREQHEEPPVALPTPGKPSPTRFREFGWVLAGAAALVGVYRVAESGHSPADYKAPRVAQVQSAPEPVRQETVAPIPEEQKTAPVRVAFTPTEPVWVSVKCDGALRYTGTLLGPETTTFQGAGVVTVLIGNAGGLSISLNGRPVPAVGVHGEIRLLEFTPSGAHRLPRTSISPNTTDQSPQA